MVVINDFAMSLVAVFIPVYLLKLGYPFSMVMVWLMIHHSSLLIGAFMSVYCSNKIGLVHSLHIRFILLFAWMTLLFVLSDHPLLFFVIPILSGLEAAFFWEPLNILYVRNTEAKTMGQATSKFFAYPKIIAMISPLVGALVTYYFGFSILFGLACIILFFAFIPLLPLRSEKTDFHFTLGHAKEIYNNNKQFFIPEIIDNLVEDATALWSIFIYMKLVSVVQVGIIGTITSFATIFFTLTLGKLTDKWNKHKLLTIGASLVIFSWLLNAIVADKTVNPWFFYLATVGATLSLKVFLVPYSTLLFNRARKDDAQFIILREIPNIMGRLILFSLAILLHNNLPVLFLMVGLSFIFFVNFDTKKLESNALQNE